MGPDGRSVEEWAFQILNLPWADKFNIAERQHAVVGILRAYAAAQVAEARAKERAACAKIAESWYCRDCGPAIAAAIRARRDEG